METKNTKTSISIPIELFQRIELQRLKEGIRNRSKYMALLMRKALTNAETNN